jgi:hypothetical protein
MCHVAHLDHTRRRSLLSACHVAPADTKNEPLHPVREFAIGYIMDLPSKPEARAVERWLEHTPSFAFGRGAAAPMETSATSNVRGA